MLIDYRLMLQLLLRKTKRPLHSDTTKPNIAKCIYTSVSCIGLLQYKLRLNTRDLVLMRYVASIMVIGSLMYLGCSGNKALHAETSCITSAGSFIPRNVTLFNSCTTPNIVHTGNNFTVNSTLINGLPNGIKILSFGCGGPLKATFDKNVVVMPTGAAICFNPKPISVLESHKHMLVSAPHVISVFKAISPGKTTANMGLEYQIQNNNKDTEFNKNEKTYVVSQPFIFTVTR
jgi:hypothetical protein